MTKFIAGLLVSLIVTASAQATPATSAVGWGYNGRGELGAGYKGAKSSVPVGITGITGIQQLVRGGEWAEALLTDGTIKAWGGNDNGQLGDGTTAQKLNAVTVKGLAGPVLQIAGAGEHMIALLANGTVETWGSDNYGQLGNGTTLHGSERGGSPTPVPVPGLSGVVAVFAGGADDAVLLSDGTVEAWGENKNGQLGDGTTVEKDSPTRVLGLTAVKEVALGADASLGGDLLALLSNGTVEAVGNDSQGQLGNGSTTSSLSPAPVKGLAGVAAISASYTHSLALVDGRAFSWGRNEHGALGYPTSTTCGRNPMPCETVPTAVPGLSAVGSISAGYGFSLAASGGKAYSWGQGSYGKLGDGSIDDRTAPGLVSGISEVFGVVAGETDGFALLGGSAPPPGISVTANIGSLTVSWEAPPVGVLWTVAYRPVVVPPAMYQRRAFLSPDTRRYMITGLEPRPYEVVVQERNGGSFGRRVVAGTPLR
jgi:alpha-tubulin suppressor-like RCC1 family protein